MDRQGYLQFQEISVNLIDYVLKDYHSKEELLSSFNEVILCFRRQQRTFNVVAHIYCVTRIHGKWN